MDLDALRQPGLDFGELAFHQTDGLQGIRARSRITTIPDTASPIPFQSAAPRRISGPSETAPRSRMRSLVPGIAMLAMSSAVWAYPRPRIMYSAPADSRTRPPVSAFPARTASETLWME